MVQPKNTSSRQASTVGAAGEAGGFVRNEYITPETKLLSKRRDFYDEKERFESEKSKFKESENLNKVAEVRIREQDARMQETLIKCCKLLQDNENERLKAKQSWAIETNILKQKEDEHKTVKIELDTEINNKGKISTKLDHLKQYDDFVTRVISEHRDMYANKNELIQRHQTLKEANEKLEDQRERGVSKLDELKRKFAEDEKKKANDLLTLNNSISGLQKRIEDLEAEKAKYEAQLEGSKKNTFTEAVIIGRIFMAIDNLRTRCQAFNSSVAKRRRQQTNIAGAAARKKDAPAVQLPPLVSGKEPQTQTSLGPEATYASAGAQGGQTLTKLEGSDGNKDEEKKKAEDDKIFDVKQASESLKQVMEDMRTYREIISKLNASDKNDKGGIDRNRNMAK